MLLIDFKKAYDSIHRESSFNVLKEFEIPQKLINLIKMSIEYIDIKVKVGHSTLKAVQVIVGLKQGDALSPILFNTALEKVIRNIGMDEKGVRLGESKITLLVYMDDIVLRRKIKNNSIDNPKVR